MEIIRDVIQFGILLVAVVTIIYTQRTANKQYQYQFFAEYTKRYQDLILQMPDDLDISSINCKDVDKFMRLYFDLCSEEFYLRSKGVIDNKVWELWEDGIRTTMRKPKYKTAWKLLGSYYDDENFSHFMNNLTR